VYEPVIHFHRLDLPIPMPRYCTPLQDALRSTRQPAEVTCKACRAKMVRHRLLPDLTTSPRRRGRTSTIRITLSPEERAQLQQILHQRACPAWLYQRVRMVLLRAEGLSLTVISQRVGLSYPHTQHWLRQWQQGGLRALYLAKGLTTTRQQQGVTHG